MAAKAKAEKNGGGGMVGEYVLYNLRRDLEVLQKEKTTDMPPTRRGVQTGLRTTETPYIYSKGCVRMLHT